MAGSGNGRRLDPRDQVSRTLQQRRGIIGQADIQETQKAVARLGGLGELPEEMPGSLDVAQDLTFGRDGGSRWNQDEEEKTFALSTQKAGTEYPLYVYRYDPVDNTTEFSAYDLYSGATYLNFGSFGATENAYVHLLGVPFRIYADVTISGPLFEYDPATRAFNVNGHPVGTSADRWESGAHADANAATITAKGMAAWTNPATVSNGDNTNGAWISSVTTAVSGDASGPNGPAIYRPDWGIDASFWVTPGSLTNVRYWVGLCASDPSAGASPAVDTIAFRYDSTVDTGWSPRTRSATGSNTAANAGTINANSPNLLRIQATSTEVNYSVDGVLVATHSTPANIPGTTYLAPYCRVTTLSANTRSVRFGFFTALSK